MGGAVRVRASMDKRCDVDSFSVGLINYQLLKLLDPEIISKCERFLNAFDFLKKLAFGSISVQFR